MSIQLNESEIVAFRDSNHKGCEVFGFLSDLLEFDKPCPVGCPAEERLVIVADEFDARCRYSCTGSQGLYPNGETIASAFGGDTQIRNEDPLMGTVPFPFCVARHDLKDADMLV